MPSKASQDLTGRRFGRWTVLRRAERLYYWVCRCDCGTEKELYYNSLLSGNSHGCTACADRHPYPPKTDTFFRRAKEKEGQTIHGWKVLEVLPEKSSGNFLCRAVCPKCGRETKVKLSRLSVISQCADCARDIGSKASTIHSVTYTGGSSLSSIRSRTGGHINKNSATGVNGVSRLANGRYRAYINFRRKQYSLGFFDTPEEAAAARKEAEELIYTPYLKEHEGWEDELAARLSALRSDKK